MPSANLDEAVKIGIKARVINNGQSCIAAKRFIVADEIADKFERAFVSTMESLKLGDPFDEKNRCGAARQCRRGDVPSRRRSQNDRGRRETSDRRQTPGWQGKFLCADRLSNIPNNSPAYRKNFWPRGLIFRVKSADEAIRVANDSRFGLGASAWTNDKSEQETLHQRT